MTTADDLDMRRRRAIYRAQHRGTKEMDLLMGRYAEAHLAAMTETELGRFETLLALPDPELQRAILDPGGAPSGWTDPAASVLSDLIAELRRFHGLGRDI